METKIANKKIRITKTIDFYADRGGHPNGIGVGHVHEGIAYNDLKEGNALNFTNDWHTSAVKKINDDGTFETKSGVYKLEILD